MRVIGALMLTAAVLAVLWTFNNMPAVDMTAMDVGMMLAVLLVIFSFATIGAILYVGGAIVSALRRSDG